MDKRRFAVLAVIAAFMVVPVAHVAAYTGSLERDGWQWVGWFYAVGVDVSIATCAWFTRWATTKKTASLGYVLFSVMDGAFNLGYIEPWNQASKFAAWSYALLPTAAVIVLGWLARDVGKLKKRTASADVVKLRAELKDSRATVARMRAEVEQARVLKGAKFTDFAQLYNGDGAGLREMSPSAGNVELVTAGFAPVAESTWRNWRDKLQKGASDAHNT